MWAINSQELELVTVTSDRLRARRLLDRLHETWITFAGIEYDGYSS